MRYQIDQSGKVESTNKLTIVAFANGKAKSLKITAIEKQKVLKAMRSLGYYKKVFVFKTFAGLIFLLIKDEEAEEVVIDIEYLGNERIIEIILLQLFRKAKKRAPRISFKAIGKRSKAHKIAIEVFRGKRKPDKVVKSKELLRLFL